MAKINQQIEDLLHKGVGDVAVAQRIRMMVRRCVSEPTWGYEVGILHFTGKLTDLERVAADRYAREMARYGADQDLDPDLVGDDKEDQIYSTRDRMYELRSFFKEHANGRRIVDHLNALVVDNNRLTEKGLKLAKEGLQVLIVFFGLRNKTGTKKWYTKEGRVRKD